jgi:hypothetical protein
MRKYNSKPAGYSLALMPSYGRGGQGEGFCCTPVKPLTLPLSQWEGRPLSWAPSADAVAGGGDRGGA